ncbi:MAG: CPBP family intramembrane metalloprotease [Bacteroidaceae bacterium]|nr:CPBP family intramembrane metalloprotease [Bacteroidaceae bacterium]
MKRTIKLVIYYFLYQLLFTVVVMFGAVLVEATKSGGDLNELMSVLQSGKIARDPIVVALGTLLAALMMLWHLFHYKYITFSTAYLKKKNLAVLLVCIPFIYSLMYLGGLMMEAVNLPNLLEDTFMDMSHSIWGIISIALVAPVLEECLFRGAIEGHLLTLWKGKPWAAIVVSGLIFGIIHLNPAQMLYASIIGIVLGWLRWRTGSVYPGIIGHILNNSLAVVFMRFYGADGSFEESFGESSQLWFAVAYAVVLIACFVFLHKKTAPLGNFSEVSDV